MKHGLKANGSHQSGFTLVEIAIVLVIIGLLLGGVLKGQELIKNARVKSYKTTADAISTAFHTYVDRRHALPGDDARPPADPPGLEGWVVAGDGNGWVSGSVLTGNTVEESAQFIFHLVAAGLIKGGRVDTEDILEMVPKGPGGEYIGVASNVNGAPGLSTCFGTISGEMAELVDIAYDDGRPGGGSIRVSANQALASYFALNANYKSTNYNLCMQL